MSVELSSNSDVDRHGDRTEHVDDLLQVLRSVRVPRRHERWPRLPSHGCREVAVDLAVDRLNSTLELAPEGVDDVASTS